jgi:hypothetical protein
MKQQYGTLGQTTESTSFQIINDDADISKYDQGPGGSMS